MKRVLSIVLAAALVVALAVPTFAGEMVLSGKEAGLTISASNGAVSGGDKEDKYINDAYIKVGTVQFKDGNFVFEMKDLTLNIGKNDNEVTVNTDAGKWYAQTGGPGMEFTLSNNKGKWVNYLGYFKPTVKMDKDAKALLTVKGAIAGVDVAANAYKSASDNHEAFLSAKESFGGVDIAGFVGTYTPKGGNSWNFYGGDVTVPGFAGSKLMAGVYANTGKGLAYQAEMTGLKVSALSNVDVSAKYTFANDKISAKPAEWKDGNVPFTANTKEFYGKAVTNVDLFNADNKVTAEMTNYLAPKTNKFVLTDEFSLSKAISGVKLVYTFGSAVANATFSAEATVVPGIPNLTLYPKVETVAGGNPTLHGSAKYEVGKTKVLAGVKYANKAMDRYYIYGENKSTFGTLDTTVAGMYYKKDGLTKLYKRAYGKVTTDLSPTLTGVGVEALYREDTGTKNGAVALTGSYVIDESTKLNASYTVRTGATEFGHVYAEVVKTVGSATFKVAYGDNNRIKTDDKDGNVSKPDFKEWIKDDNVIWRPILGTKGADQTKLSATVTVKF